MFYFRPSASHALTFASKFDRPRWFESLATSLNATPHQPRLVQSQMPEGSPLVEIQTHPTDSRQLKDQNSKRGGSNKQAHVDSWRGQHIGTVDFLPRLTEPVSSSLGYDVIGTFNTRLSPPEEVVLQEQRVTSVYIPGKPPKWDRPPLPFKAPDDATRLKGRLPLKFGHADVVEKYLWKLPMMAIHTQTPDFPFHHVDVMITAKRLEGFWKYCQGASAQELAANATVINNTLFIDAFEPVGLETGSELDRSSLYALSGSSWHRKYLDSFLCHRILYYRFGSLNIAVIGSVDALVDDRVAQVHLFDNIFPTGSIMGWRGFYQTWFRRCPVVIAARQKYGSVMEEFIIDASSYWKRWETFENNQVPLQRLVSIFQKLRDMLRRKAPGEPCVVQKGPKLQRSLREPRTNDDTPAQVSRLPQQKPKEYFRRLHSLEVWQATHGRHPLPPDWAERFELLSSSRTPLKQDQTSEQRSSAGLPTTIQF